MVPRDRAIGERVEQKVAQCPAVDLGASGERAGLRCVVHEGAAGRVEDAVLLALGARLRPEVAGEAGVGQRLLPGLGMQVEHPAL
ncbi:hypothetical protein Phou_057430 [Phytohabitans houttuyneae]|uniref:Uncharacterized protein n=1 Tax=Phytohabitans houttuyneae TaxID=1076126 RepID=A0A6V8K8N8_9ACTN|nr:hypothetical protein Phou_057430 [Phytohabitans houttuyneae]